MSLRPVLLAAVFWLDALPAPAQQPGSQPTTLTVFAAASLTDAFEELGALFRRRHPGTAVRFNFAGSQQLALQLEHGAAADLLASADQRWMARVDSLGLLAGEPIVFAHNRLVVIVPRDNPARIERLEHLARPGVKLVLAADAVPAGRYARQMLGNLAGRPGFGVGFERRVLGNVVSEEENVKAVVAKVQLGEADAGITYRSDVTPAAAPRLAVLEIPEPSNVLASYPIAVLAAARYPRLAHAFVVLTRDAEGRRILEGHRLMPAPPVP